MIVVREYIDAAGNSPYARWFDGLSATAAAKVTIVVTRMSQTKALSDGYNALVRDIEVNVGNILTSWNPLSHTGYWTDDDVQEPLAEHLKTLLA